MGLELVAATGIEPATYRLSGDCSTLLSYAAIMAIRTEFESVIFRVTGGCLKPLDERTFKLVPTERIELPTFGLQNRCTTAVLYGRYSGAHPRNRAAISRLRNGCSGR